MKAVHEGLMKEMQDTFHYLQNVFGARNMIVHPMSISHPVATVEIVNDIIPEAVTHEETVETDSLASDEVPPMPEDPTIKHIVVHDNKAKMAMKSEAATTSSPKSKNSVEVKQQKQQHRDAVEKKRQELVAKGVKPESLLTEANLRKWINEGMSYLKIAKETGVHEVQVSNVAKSFGLQSKISRYVAMKKTV
jgi:hypothetical protein